jgi:recombination protein RecA
MAPPFREAEFDILYNQGISYEGDVLDLAVDRKLVEKSGAWFSYKGERLGQGRENAKQFLREHPDILHALDVKLREIMGLLKPAPAEAKVK